VRLPSELRGEDAREESSEDRSLSSAALPASRAIARGGAGGGSVGERGRCSFGAAPGRRQARAAGSGSRKRGSGSPTTMACCVVWCCVIIDSRDYVDRHATGRLRVVVDGAVVEVSQLVG
jgi:hypothetical protein